MKSNRSNRGAFILASVMAAACSSAPQAETSATSAAAITSAPPFATPVQAKASAPLAGGSGVKPQDLGFSADPMTGTVNMYFIVYGDWTDSPSSPQVLFDLANTISGSPYIDILSTWSASTTQSLGASSIAYLNATGSILLDDNDVQTLVSTIIGVRGWPADPNGVYFFVAGDNVTLIDAAMDLSFCSNMCGYHYAMPYEGQTIKYAWIGNPKHCGPLGQTGACFQAQPYMTDANAPHGDAAGDSMAFTMAHELAEAITDPFPYLDVNDILEIDDTCAGTFPQLFYTNGGSSGTIANATLWAGTSKAQSFILPSIDVNMGTGFCALSLPSAPKCVITAAPCGESGVEISCSGEIAGDLNGDVQFQRDGVTFATTQGSDTVYPTWPVTDAGIGLVDTTAGTHEWQVCSGNGAGGLDCYGPETFSNPGVCCPAGDVLSANHCCPAGETWNGGMRHCEVPCVPTARKLCPG
jgi:hypothetical protein